MDYIDGVFFCICLYLAGLLLAKTTLLSKQKTLSFNCFNHKF